MQNTFISLAALMLVSLGVNASQKDALQRKLANIQSLEAEFGQTVTDDRGEVLQQAQGRLAWQQPSRFYFALSSPDESMVLADGHSLYHLDPMVEQAVVMSQASAAKQNPIMLLADPGHPYWQEVRVEGEQEQFRITTTDPQAPIHRLELTFKQGTLSRITSYDLQGQQSQWQLTNVRQNHALPADMFIFTLPTGFELDDQRTR